MMEARYGIENTRRVYFIAIQSGKSDFNITLSMNGNGAGFGLSTGFWGISFGTINTAKKSFQDAEGKLHG